MHYVYILLYTSYTITVLYTVYIHYIYTIYTCVGRYMVTEDENKEKTVHVMSEVGVTKSLAQFSDSGATSTGERLIDSGRLGPGEMLTVDLKKGAFLLNDELKDNIAQQRPYGEWLGSSVHLLPSAGFAKEVDVFIDNNIADPLLQKAALAIDRKEVRLYLLKSAYYFILI